MIKHNSYVKFKVHTAKIDLKRDKRITVRQALTNTRYPVLVNPSSITLSAQLHRILMFCLHLSTTSLTINQIALFLRYIKAYIEFYNFFIQY